MLGLFSVASKFNACNCKLGSLSSENSAALTQLLI